jgi:hypothetical protein
MRRMKYILIAAVMFILASCVYEYPVYIPAGTQLKLTFKLDSTVLKSYPQMSDLRSEDYDVRYVIKAYRKTNSGNLTATPHKEFVYTKDDITSLDSTYLVELDEGDYTFYTVTDFVPQYMTGDNHFNTASFNDLFVRCENYHGSTESKTLYTGIQDIKIERFNGQETSTDTIRLTPVLFKYQIVATDLKKFYDDRIPEGVNHPDYAALHLENYVVKVRYDEKEPLFTHMNIYRGCKPTWGVAGLSYMSKITKLNDDEAMLCFDHIMVGEDQKEIRLKVGIYEKNGTHITTVPVKFPVHTGKFKCVKGEFLTYIGLEDPENGGVTLNPGWNGDIDINN